MYGWLIVLALWGAYGCTAMVDKSSVKATAGAPESAQVEIVHIPYDPSLPKYVVTVEPFRMGTSGASVPVQGPRAPRYYGWGPFGWGLWPGTASPAPEAYTPGTPAITEQVGTGIAGQLLSALSNAGNIVVVDYDHYVKNQGKIGLRQGEVGPFIIKGTVTEFNEVAEVAEESTGGSLGWAGTVLGIAGAVAGVPGAGIAGAAVSAANPTFENTKARRTGSVGMDLQLVQPDSGRILGAVVVAGKFVAESATNGASLFGVGGGGSAFAASALGQATRAATNDAIRQIMARLSTNR